MNELRHTVAGEAPAVSEPRARFAVQAVRTPDGWSAVVLTQPYPLPSARSVAYKALVRELLAALPETRTHHAEGFLQMDRIGHGQQSAYIRDLGAKLGDYGLGYYPDQPPPATWSREEVGALFPPAKLRPLFHDVMRVESSQESITEVAKLFQGGGSFAWAFCRDANSFYSRCTEQFKPLVTSRKLQMFPYYAPMLTRRAVEGCDASCLSDWTCGAELYLRESIEDNGLLVIRRGDLAPALRHLMQDGVLPEAVLITDLPAKGPDAYDR